MQNKNRKGKCKVRLQNELKVTVRGNIESAT